MENKRFHMLDTLRGVLIIGVVISHFFIDMQSIGSAWADAFLANPVVDAVSAAGRMLFVLLAGICSELSRNNLKRGLFVLAAAAAVSLATLILDLVLFGELGYMFIYMGILHLLAVCMLTYALFEQLLKNAPRPSSWLLLTAAGVSSLLFAATYRMTSGIFGIGSLSVTTPTLDTVPGAVLGIGTYEPLISADWFPILPWGLIFLCGVCLGVFFKEDTVPAFLHVDVCPPVTKIGTKTLWIYLLHQPVVFGIAFLVSYIFN